MRFFLLAIVLTLASLAAWADNLNLGLVVELDSRDYLPYYIQAPASTWTLIAHAQQQGTNSLTVVSPAINDTGSTLDIVAIADVGDVTLGTVTDSASNTFTLVAQVNTPNPSGTRCSLWYALNPTISTSHTFTYTTTQTAFAAMSVEAWHSSGGSTTGALDQNSTGTNNSGTSVAAGSITPLNNNELIASVSSIGGTDTGLAVSPGTLDANIAYSPGQSFGLGSGYLIQTTAGAANITYTITASAVPLCAISASFTPHT